MEYLPEKIKLLVCHISEQLTIYLMYNCRVFLHTVTLWNKVIFKVTVRKHFFHLNNYGNPVCSCHQQQAIFSQRRGINYPADETGFISQHIAVGIFVKLSKCML